MHTVLIRRQCDKNPRKSLKEQIDYILNVAIRGARKEQQKWKCQKIEKDEKTTENGWIGQAILHIEKTGGRGRGGDAEAKQWDKILEMIAKAGRHACWRNENWDIVSEEDEDFNEAPGNSLSEKKNPEDKKNKSVKVAPGVQTVLVPDHVLTWEELREKFPHELLQDESGAAIDNHPNFKGIYGRAPFIRIMLSSIWSFLLSEGEKTSHQLLYGLPACAKTKVLSGVCDLFGPGSYLKLDSTNFTRAGFEKLIFKELKEVPKFIVMEEIEKADEGTLAMWLGGMDDRHEFRKVNFHNVLVRQVYFMGMATANDKAKFDRMMGGSPNGDAGALSSRFSIQLNCPRPSEEEMRQILIRELPKINGSPEWIDPCMELASSEFMGTNDPREIIGYLDGRERLLTGKHQSDILFAAGKKEKINKLCFGRNAA